MTQKQQMSAISKSNLTCICQSIASFNISIHSDNTESEIASGNQKLLPPAYQFSLYLFNARKPKVAATGLPTLLLFIERQETKSCCRPPTWSPFIQFHPSSGNQKFLPSANPFSHYLSNIRKPNVSATRLPALPLYIQRQETKSLCRPPTCSPFKYLTSWNQKFLLHAYSFSLYLSNVRKPKVYVARLPVLPLFIDIQRQVSKYYCRPTTRSPFIYPIVQLCPNSA